MTDLVKLAETYNLEGNLYYGGGLQKILRLIGDQRKRRFLKFISMDKPDDREKWAKLEIFLQDERDEREVYVVNEKPKGAFS